PFGFENEAAAQYDSLQNWEPPVLHSNEAAAPVGDGADSDHLDREINRRLAAPEESAARFTQKSLNMTEISHTNEGYLKMLSDQTGYRVVNLANYGKPEAAIVHLLTAEQAKRLVAVPVAENELGQLMIAV